MGVFIIAEAGVNHNGSLVTAMKLVDKAKMAGVNCVKFQTYRTENLVSKGTQKADYQVKNTGNQDSQFDMLKKLELTYEEFEKLKNYCDEKQIEFLSTPFDLESMYFLNRIGIKLWKVPSGEITNRILLEKIANTKKPVILSTGMSTIQEIEDAISVLRDNGCDSISLMHCTTEYPTPYSEVNLKALDTLKGKFRVDVGYSDHTKGIEIPIAAVACGAKIIEKHFTLDKDMEGPDHKASLSPVELQEMVSAIRNVEAALGDGVKTPTCSEKKNIAIARKSIVARCNIQKGEPFTESNLTVKRPGTGVSPMRWYEVIGLTADRDYKEDELIEI